MTAMTAPMMKTCARVSLLKSMVAVRSFLRAGVDAAAAPRGASRQHARSGVGAAAAARGARRSAAGSRVTAVARAAIAAGRVGRAVLAVDRTVDRLYQRRRDGEGVAGHDEILVLRDQPGARIIPPAAPG